MSAKRLKIASALVLANYGLALTVGGAFHLHGGHRPAGDCGHSASAGSPHAAGRPMSDHAGCCHPKHPASEGSLPSLGRWEKCPVCQFLAKKPVSGPAVQDVACMPLFQTWVPVKPLRLAESFPFTHPIRGPPAVG